MKQPKTPKFAAIILAAGKGTRMRSNLPKVMHKLAGKPLIGHVLAALKSLNPEKTILVIAPGIEEVKKTALTEKPTCLFAIQKQQLGTGHAVMSAESALKNYTGTILILYGDAPLITPGTLANLLKTAESSDIAVLGMQLDDPTGYGRLVTDGKNGLKEIVECKDANPTQKYTTLCNSGIMAINGKVLWSLLKQLKTKNAAGEYYLTDIIGIANAEGLRCAVAEAEPDELAGINSREQLADAEYIMQQRLRQNAMEQGATLVDPETIYLSTDTHLGYDVTVHPQVVFGPGVSVASGAEIRSFSHIEGAEIGKNAIIGPFARIRPGGIIGEGAHVGNFVEIKKSKLGKGAKANHLSYIGDAEIGEGANIGAGTITCNYDGVAKHKTTIGAGAFIGSNTSLVAPVSIGKNAVVGAGSTITEDVKQDALAIARAPQINKPAKAKTLKQRKQKRG